MEYGKTITIYFDNGTPDGIVTASLSNWNGVGIKVPREDINRKEYEELDGPGVYFLICTDTDDDQDAIYIGEAENIRKRLQQHVQSYKNGSEKYYWQNAVMFTGSELNKTLIRYLEHTLTTMARAAKRYVVLTKSTYGESIIKRHERAAMDQFISNIQTLLSALNYRILDPLIDVKKKDHSGNRETKVVETFKMTIAGCYGEGYLTSDSKFVLLAGSKIWHEEFKSCPTSVVKKRKNAIESRIVDENWITVEDILFTSPSAAASFIGGCSLSGPLYWKNDKGISLGEIRKM